MDNLNLFDNQNA
jgi:hypothetical protein